WVFLLCWMCLTACSKVVLVDSDNSSGGFSIADKSAGGVLPPVQFSTSNPGLDLNSVDFYCDGKPDLAAPLLGGDFAMLVNTSHPGVISFVPSAAHNSGDQLASIAVARFDGDQYPDVFLLHNSGLLEIQHQTAQGTLQTIDSFTGV